MKHVHACKDIGDAVSKALRLLSGYDREFYERVWATDLDVYRERLKALGFEGLDDILDAGSGNGQWTLCLAERNTHVSAIDVSESRLNATKCLLDHLGVRNCDLINGTIESCELPDSAFDAIFSYSVLYFTDHRHSLREFFRVLKPGGVIYVCTNGLGWYIYNLLTPHNPSSDFDIREMAIEAIGNTFEFLAEGHRQPNAQLAISSQMLGSEAAAAGFADITLGGEGTLASRPGFTPQSFFESRYHGLEGVYEMLATKPTA